MEAIEAVAVVILIVAIVVLIYYYLLNSPATMNKLKRYVPTSADAHMDEILGRNNHDYADLTPEEPPVEKENGESMGKRLKIKLSDIDMSSINTDAFSKKIDAFLDEKSEELIKDWSLATTDDLDELESKFSKTTDSVDELEKTFEEFKKSSEEFQINTEKKLDDFDKRIESLENK